MEPATPAAAGAPSETPRGTALIVDDELANCRLLARMLQREGFRTLEALSGEVALELFTAERPDIVFMDVMMPELSGLETTTRIKQLSGMDFVPVIFLTALSDEESMTSCIAAGGDDFLSKPFSLGVLKSRIRAMERVRDLHRRLAAQKLALAEMLEREHEEQALAERVLSYAVGNRNAEVERLALLQRPAALFNGDLVLTQRLPDGGLRILLGDFTGHGLAAAFGALPVADIFHTLTRRGADDARVLAAINRKLHQVLPADRFMAAVLVSIPASGDALYWWNGGMPSGWLRTRAALVELSSHALPLGIQPEFPTREPRHRLALSPGDRLLLMSDGLLEALDRDGRMFIERGLMELLHGWRPDEALLPTLVEALDRHCEQTEQLDDIALLECPLDAATMPVASGQLVRGSSGSWNWSLELRDGQIGNPPSLRAALGPLGLLDGLETQEGALETVFAELYANALEHGVLGLSSQMKRTADGFEAYYRERSTRLVEGCQGWVRVEVRFEPQPDGGLVVISVSDSGRGFNLDAEHFPSPDASCPWGRGLALVRGLCESVDIDPSGSRVEAQYRW
ncbi:ATP-binding SpoIIE family protein phosphatase [Marichromatium bheemlicum]|uniref:Fused response regulator/phosphatase n=1 Tax=Marichromatium bheemlicum TaxID=365339 RepID=A0ABX1IB45_9GAMM|nr:fused response regulator/phosphatase [Marichromatium bheemlicum]NKN33321.1 fused response regulator/phosphatase [Marichromatium bheemlicum]